jgi:ubiquinone biosynthesis accessory factor UbiJ
LIPALYLPPLNRLLRQNSWAMERLRPFAAKVVRVDCFPLTLLLAITDAGDAIAAAPEMTPDVTIRLTPGVMLRLAARDASAWSDIAVEGDPSLAAALNHIARNIRWDVEEDLSRVFGDIAAHRMVETGRKLDNWGRQGADNLARSFTEYWTEEQPLIAGRSDVEQFNRDVDALRDDLARLEKRIEQVTANRSTR